MNSNAERIAAMTLAKQNGEKVVAYVVEDTKTAQFRYRCLNPVRAVTASEEWKAVWFLTEEIDKLEKQLELVDLIVVVRQTAKSDAILNLIKTAQGSGKKVLFDLDDLIFDYKDLPVLMKATGSRNVLYWMGYVWGIRRIAKLVDGFVVTNDFLGKKIKQSFDKPYAVMPNSLDAAQVNIAEGCIKKKQHRGFRIGYFSGSPTHRKDFEMVEPEIMDFLKNHSDASLWVVGYMEFSRGMQKFMEAGRVKTWKMMDYLKLMEKMAEVDVNIAPLLVNDFTNSKSELKFFEAAVVDTPTIASPAYAFKKAISDKNNGLLANEGGWYREIEYLYNNSDERMMMAKNAREYAMENYYGVNFLKKVEEVYERFAE